MNWSGMPVWTTFLIVGAIAEVAKALLIRRLRNQHPYVWEELGEPDYFSKRSFDILGRLSPYRKDVQDPISRDMQVLTLIVVRRASWWVLILAFVGLWLSGRGSLLTIYRSTEPLSIPAYAAVVIATLAIIAIAWRARRHRE